MYICVRAHISLVKPTNDLLSVSDRGLVSFLVLRDLSAAVDTIDHSILEQRLLQEIKITGTTLDWLNSYLSDRFHVVHVNDVSSEHTIHGIPQGLVHGLILFTLYMLPLGSSIRDMASVFIVTPMIHSCINPLHLTK